jgi:hypothetical protein
MSLLGKLSELFAKEEIPEIGERAVRIHLLGTVASPNEATSPMSGMTASLIVLSLLERLIRHGGSAQSGQTEKEQFRPIASVGFGTLHVADRKNQLLEVPVMQNGAGMLDIDVFPLSQSGVPMDTELPPALARFTKLASGEHMLFWRETLFRNGDPVRIRATISKGSSIRMGGYRDVVTAVLQGGIVTARPDLGRIELHERL